MATDRLLTLVDECVELGVFDLTLAGGEPLLHPAALDVISRAVSKGLRVGLLTNGIRLNDQVRSELERRTDKRNFLVQVSLDSVDPGVNDRTRGRTNQVVENIRALAGGGLDVQIACVISRANAGVAHLLIDEFYPAVKRFHFLNIQRTEQALKHPELLLDEEDCRQFWLHLNEYRKHFPPDLFLPSLRVQMRSGGLAQVEPEFSVHGERATFACSSCSAGWTHIHVDADFNMLGCDIAKDYTFMGNLRDNTFAEVWNSEQAAIVRSAAFPACYRIQDPAGGSMMQLVREDLVAIAQARSSESIRPRPTIRKAMGSSN